MAFARTGPPSGGVYSGLVLKTALRRCANAVRAVQRGVTGVTGLTRAGLGAERPRRRHEPRRAKAQRFFSAGLALLPGAWLCARTLARERILLVLGSS